MNRQQMFDHADRSWLLKPPAAPRKKYPRYGALTASLLLIAAVLLLLWLVGRWIP
jgi:hypothetical protein